MPFEQIKIGRWLIEVDREATQAAYINEQPISACGCDYCQNYFAACSAEQAHSPATFVFFQCLGITPEKEAEVYVLYANPEKTHVYYGGFYHLVARIIDTTEGSDYSLVDDQFGIAFSEQNDLLSTGFPRPALQMEFTGFIPWVLRACPKRPEKPFPVVELVSASGAISYACKMAARTNGLITQL